MKDTKICPQCNFTDILRIPARTGSSSTETLISVGTFKTIKITRYVCATCGYTEEWIESLEDIEKLRSRHEEAE